jgi:DNA polymerase III delta subunit
MDRAARGQNPVIYCIHGPDRLLARESALAIAAEFDPDGTNTSWLDGREITIDRIASDVGMLAFFGSPRIVIVSDLLGRVSREPDDVEPEGSRSRAFPGLETLIAAVPDQNVLILFEPSLTSVPASFRSTAPAATIIAGEPPRGRALLEWLERAALRGGSQIDRRTAQRLVETLYPQTWDRKPNNPRYDRPPDMALLSQEIEKLALAAHPGPITSEHIAALTSSGPDQRVFRFLDAALTGDLRPALYELERLTAAGEEPAMLLAQLLGQAELAMVASAAGDMSADAVARDLGTVAPGRMSAVMASTKRQGSRTQRAIKAGTRTDRALKTGRIRRPEDALHDVMLALSLAESEKHPGRSG